MSASAMINSADAGVIILDWSGRGHWRRAPRPCRWCGSATSLRDGTGVASHKICAEAAAADRLGRDPHLCPDCRQRLDTPAADLCGYPQHPRKNAKQNAPRSAPGKDRRNA